MEWFSKLINTAYGYSDGLIKFRQDRANKKYKIEKAEKEALRIMKEQENKKKNAMEKRGRSIADEESFTFMAFLDKMEEDEKSKHV